MGSPERHALMQRAACPCLRPDAAQTVKGGALAQGDVLLAAVVSSPVHASTQQRAHWVCAILLSHFLLFESKISNIGFELGLLATTLYQTNSPELVQMLP